MCYIIEVSLISIEEIWAKMATYLLSITTKLL